MHIGKIPANQGYVNNLDLDFNIFIFFAVHASFAAHAAWHASFAAHAPGAHHAAPHAYFLPPHRLPALFLAMGFARRRAQ